ncbi:MAG: ATPase, T2SS/T4P/T4SS family [Patescibacteria group bacterium]
MTKATIGKKKIIAKKVSLTQNEQKPILEKLPVSEKKALDTSDTETQNKIDAIFKKPLPIQPQVSSISQDHDEVKPKTDTDLMENFPQNLFNILKELGVIDEKKLTDAFEESKKNNISLAELLITNDLISDADLGKTVAELLHFPFIELSAVKIPSDLVYLIPEEYSRTHKVIAFEENDKELKIAIVDPTLSAQVTQFIEQKAQKKPSVFYATQRDFEKALKIYKQNLQSSYDDMLKEQVKTIGKNGISEAPIERIVDILIEYAYDNGASDIHIEPEKEGSTVRFRIDGIMQEVLHFTPEIDQQVVARIKFLSKLRTDEHLSAQDGKIQTRVENEDLDIRISIVPILHGEKCVMRLLSARYRQFGLSDLGMSSLDLKKVLDASSKPYGMILSTGPTGSGKTTSMYTILKILNTKERNIATIEDPIEYEIKGLNQIQVNPKTNLTFAEGLRSILRQDPNIIYVGEIRDNETADIAVNSAMTGHLVLSTLHTNDAATALPRFLDMNIEPFLVASTVNIVIGQRLVRRICDKCKVSQSEKISDLEKHFNKKLLQKYFKDVKEARIYIGKGCPVCRNSGYSGRVGIFEILLMSEKIKDLVVAKNDSQKIIQQAVSEGMTTMMDDGLSKVQQGITTIEEVLRATRE